VRFLNQTTSFEEHRPFWTTTWRIGQRLQYHPLGTVQFYPEAKTHSKANP
jgi:hypothetical protein